jgi:hypothetical protein
MAKEKSSSEWTAERVSTMTIQQLKNLRENAIRLGDDAVAALCKAAIENRVPPNKKAQRVFSAPRADEVVIGFHFVCPEGKGVTSNVDGTVWTGTWVVDKEHAEIGSKIGAYVALHRKKSESSGEDTMDNTTLLIIILLVLLIFGGGYYGRGRWW